jgi:hypothetical protein
MPFHTLCPFFVRVRRLPSTKIKSRHSGSFSGKQIYGALFRAAAQRAA